MTITREQVRCDINALKACVSDPNGRAGLDVHSRTGLDVHSERATALRRYAIPYARVCGVVHVTAANARAGVPRAQALLLYLILKDDIEVLHAWRVGAAAPYDAWLRAIGYSHNGAVHMASCDAFIARLGMAHSRSDECQRVLPTLEAKLAKLHKALKSLGVKFEEAEEAAVGAPVSMAEPPRPCDTGRLGLDLDHALDADEYGVCRVCRATPSSRTAQRRRVYDQHRAKFDRLVNVYLEQYWKTGAISNADCFVNFSTELKRALNDATEAARKLIKEKECEGVSLTDLVILRFAWGSTPERRALFEACSMFVASFYVTGLGIGLVEGCKCAVGPTPEAARETLWRWVWQDLVTGGLVAPLHPREQKE
jgi:hypothetical protein